MKRNIGRIGAAISVAGLTLCGLSATGVSAESGSVSGQLEDLNRNGSTSLQHTANLTEDETTTSEATPDAVVEDATVEDDAVETTTTAETETTAEAEETTTTAEETTTTTASSNSEYAEIVALGPPPAGFEDGSCAEITFNDHKLFEYNPDTPIHPVDLPAGTVWIQSADSYDMYDGRHYMTQLHETWYLEFFDASGNIVGTSSATGDVPDKVRHGRWVGTLGLVELSAPAVGVRGMHTPAGQGGAPNSVFVSSIVVCQKVEGPASTDVTTTTVAPSTTEPPDPTVKPASTTPTSEATTTAPPDPTVKPAEITPTTTPTGSLPVTGGDSRTMAGAGLSLLLAGGALLAMGRRDYLAGLVERD